MIPRTSELANASDRPATTADASARDTALSDTPTKDLLQQRFMEDIGSVLLAWKILEYQRHERGWLWYTIAGIVGAALVTYAILGNNFLFGVIIIFVALIVAIQQVRKPDVLDVAITTRGLIVEDQLYAYEQLDAFWLHYNPPVFKELGIGFVSKWRPELSIPLENTNPLKLRKILATYLSEVEREESVSTALNRILRL